MSAGQARIFLVDDHPLVREWLTSLIHQQPDLAVCGEAASAAQALDGMAATRPDLAVVDISLEGGSGIELIKRLKALHPDVSVIVLSMHDEDLYAERALRAGARGYINKRETATRIVVAIREVLQGRLYLSDRLMATFAERFVGGKIPTGGPPVGLLSDRELEVFELLGEGFETRQVAERMRVSMKTVQAFCARIKEKLNLASATELLREAIRWHDEQHAK